MKKQSKPKDIWSVGGSLQSDIVMTDEEFQQVRRYIGVKRYLRHIMDCGEEVPDHVRFLLDTPD